MLFLKATSLIVALITWPNIAHGQADFQLHMKVSFSDDTLLYGDIFYCRIQVKTIANSDATTKSAQTKNVLSYLDKAGSDAYTQLNISENSSATVMLRAIDSRGLDAELDNDSSFIQANKVLRILPRLPLSDEPEFDRSRSFLISSMFSCNSKVEQLSTLPTQGTIERSIWSNFYVPIRGFVFNDSNLRVVASDVWRVHHNFKNEPPLLNSDPFPLDLSKWEPLLAKIDHHSNIAQLIANSRSYSDALDNTQFPDAQFVKYCAALANGAKPIVRDWLANSIERNLSKTRPHMVESFRELITKTE